MRLSEFVFEEWSQKYKSSINCSHPKGFSQRAHCAGKNKNNESVEMEMVCKDCGMCETHGDHLQHSLDEACWKGYHKEGMKTMFGKRYPNCVKNEDATGVADSGPNILELLRSWRNRVPAQYARHLTKTFGEPHDATQDLIVWHDQDGFKRIEIKDEYIMHISPTPHYDYCYSYIDLTVPHKLSSALANCSESILIDHLKNEVGARCASLAANAVTLNFVMDVVAGRAQPSRDEYERRIMDMHHDFENGKIFTIQWWPDQSHDTNPDNSYYRQQHKSKPDVTEDKRIPRKAGQPTNSKQHSDLYTDENPKGTITGLKFATVEDARASVGKIRSSGRTHAHKVQAAVAMEQRARAAGKSAAASVYRAYINSVKKTNESLEVYVTQGVCPICHGDMVAEDQLNEKQDACYHKVKSRYKVWPSAYASGALVQCRKKGAANWGNKSNESITQQEYDQLDENLKKWFSDKWVRFGPDGKIRGDCARGDDSEGKPKCLPQSKAQSLGKKGRASAASRKRREDPNPERSGKAINVNTKKKSNESVAEEFNAEYDDEAGMVQGNLYTIAKAAHGLLDTIDDRDNLPEWVQEKIAKVEGMLVSAWDYLQSQKAQGIDPQVDETAAWRRKEGKSKSGGLNAKGVASYRRENPGSKLQTAVTTKPSKLKPGSKAAKRRKSFCARMGGVKGPMKKPNGKPTRKALALRKWNCESVEQMVDMILENMDHAKDNQAVPELKAALLAKKSTLQQASEDDVYDIIDTIMTRIAKSHGMSGQKLHSMWVKEYDQIPDTWIMK